MVALILQTAMAKKNNIIRLLDSRKIKYRKYDLPAEKLGARETARLLGDSVDLVYKTIVVTRKLGKPILVIVSADSEVDLKKAASCLDEKKVFLPTQDEAEKLTKLQVGGISPLALLNKGFVVILDASAQAHEQIHISGGEREINIRLGVEDLVKVTQARIADVSKFVDQRYMIEGEIQIE